MNLKLIAVVSLSAGVVACGGGGDGGSSSSTTTPQTRSIKGVAIDGYISGATAFIDLNYSGKLDSGEPSAITNKEGSYSLSLAGANSDCIDFAPIVVDVPIGAIDADSPNTPIAEPYKLVFPPAMTLSSEHEIKSTTPLTTVLWNQIQADLHQGGITSCTQLKTAVNTQDKVIQNVKQLDQRIAQRYNIAVDKIYGDFIKEKDDTVYQLAQKMMPAIKKSYSETKSIQAVNAGAQQAYVDYYWKYWDDVKKQQVDKWYKVITVMTDTKLVHKEYEVSEDLQTELLLTRQTERNTQHKDGLDYSKNATIWVRDDKTYTCDIQESLEQVVQPDALTTYSLTNSSYTQEPDWVSCANKNVGAGYAQTLKATVVNNYRDGYILADASFRYENDKVPYARLVNVADQVAGFNRSTLDHLSYLSTDFNDTSVYSADSWWRAKHQHIAITPFKYNQISISRNSHGQWWKNTYYHNGTSLTECSKDQGVTWSKDCG
ncbi:hypothetical protein ACPUEJ_21860 [Vibrio tubiashii]|uniref:hypothetical protein n=1 Tax=Vibrio tubiashii TaxID=29498 RepID=UPI003CE531ED